MSNPKEFCDAMDEWARVRSTPLEGESEAKLAEREEFEERWTRLRQLDIGKSCLLDRMLYGGEQPSQTPCPVHKGRWAGVHLWGQREINGVWHVVWVSTAGEKIGNAEEPMLAEWRGAGCRCWQHSCGCTTGWQPA